MSISLCEKKENHFRLRRTNVDGVDHENSSHQHIEREKWRKVAFFSFILVAVLSGNVNIVNGDTSFSLPKIHFHSLLGRFLCANLLDNCSTISL